MGLREIPALSLLCLRAVGNPRCKADETFAPAKDGKPSSASKLLRSFHKRPVLAGGETMKEYFEREAEAINNLPNSDDKVPTLERIPMKRTPAIGTGSGRRKQANDVDLNHPWIASYLPPKAIIEPMEEEENDENDEPGAISKIEESTPDEETIPTDPQEQDLVAESGSCALDLLQSYIDVLVEMGRMDDNRLGLHFFAEYRKNIELNYKASLPLNTTSNSTEDNSNESAEQVEQAPPVVAPVAVPAPMDAPIPKKKKRKRSGGGAFSAAKKKKEAEARAAAEAKRQAAILAAVPKSRGSLSLHNCIVLAETTSNLLNSKVLEHIHVLDLTGLQTLTDSTLTTMLQSAGLQLERLSLKNCRRLTDQSIHTVCSTCPNLTAVDFGGGYNLEPRTLLDALAVKTIKRGRGVFTSQALPKLVELHAGGIGSSGGWTDDLLPELFALRNWKALSIGFSPYLTFHGWKDALLIVEQQHREQQQQESAVLPSDDSPEGDAAAEAENSGANATTAAAATTTTTSNNMCQTLQSLGIAFCEQELVNNAWLGLVGRHLPKLRALDVRGNHFLNSMTSWYDGRATIERSQTLNKKQSLVVLSRYSGISQNGVEETKRIYPSAAAPLTVITDSDGIGWGILRQQKNDSSSDPGVHYQKRLIGAKEDAEAAKAEALKMKAMEKEEAAKKAAAATATPMPKALSQETVTKIITVVPVEDDAMAVSVAKPEDSAIVTTEKPKDDVIASTAEPQSATIVPAAKPQEAAVVVVPAKPEQESASNDVSVAMDTTN